MTFTSVTQNGRPSVRAASNWPSGMLMIPARNTSAVNAASTIDSASVAEVKESSLIPTKGSA